MDIGHKALTLTFLICAPLLGFGLVIGLIVSIFQAATQIHEATLAFVPKILAVVAALVIFGPWMMSLVLSFTGDLLRDIPTLVK